jgi:hypothetical protein
MKKSMIRLLSIFGFLLLFAPMFQQCVGVMKEVSNEMPAVDINVLESEEITDSISVKSSEDLFNEDLIHENENENNFFKIFDLSEATNGFEYTKLFYDLSRDLLVGNDSLENKDILLYSQTLMISLIVINSIFIIFFSFFNKIHHVKKLLISNIIFLAICLLCFVLQSTFETYTQIKYGFYLLVIHQTCFLYFLKKSH